MRALFAMLLCLVAAPALAGQPTVFVRKSVAVTDPVVRLGDIARLDGFAADDAKTYGRIELGRAPAVGLGQYMPRAYVEARIREGGMPAAVRLRIPQRVEIKRKARTVPGEELRQMVDNPQQMRDLFWQHISPALMAELERDMYAFSRQQLTDFVNELNS